MEAFVVCHGGLGLGLGLGLGSSWNRNTKLNITNIKIKSKSKNKNSSRHTHEFRKNILMSTTSTSLTNAKSSFSLDQVARGEIKPDGKQVASLMKEMEMATRKGTRPGQDQSTLELDQPQGDYRLVFVTQGKKNQNGNYVPTALVQAGISFENVKTLVSGNGAAGIVTNTATIFGNALGIQFRGWYEWSAESRILRFNFYQMLILAGSNTIWKTSIRPKVAKSKKNAQVPSSMDEKELDDETFFNTREDKKALPFFVFFASSSLKKYAAARGRGGGYALWTLQE